MFEVTIRRTHDMTFTATHADHSITIDAKGHEGMSPPDVQLAALGSCIGVYIEKYRKGTATGINEYVINVRSSFCEENPIRLKSIAVEIDVQGAVLDDKRRASLLRFINNCPIHSTLKHAPDISVSVT